MSTLATLQAILKAELHSNSPFVDAAIAQAFRDVRGEELSFNSKKYTLTTVADVNEYPLPDDYLGMRGDIHCSPSGSATVRYPLKRSTVDEVESYLFSISEYAAYETSGRAKLVALDGPGHRLLLAPKPSSGGDTIFFRYTCDLGTPVYSATVTSSAPPSLTQTTTLLSPDGGTIETTFTNAWFKEGFELLRSRASYILWSTYHSGTEEAQLKAQTQLLHYREEMMRLRGESAEKQSINTIRKFI